MPLSLATRVEPLRILVKQATRPRCGGPVQGEGEGNGYGEVAPEKGTCYR